MSLSVVALVAGVGLLLIASVLRVLPNRQNSGNATESIGCLLILLAVALIFIGL